MLRSLSINVAANVLQCLPTILRKKMDTMKPHVTNVTMKQNFTNVTEVPKTTQKIVLMYHSFQNIFFQM